MLIVVVPNVTVLGEICDWSTTSRAGDEMSAIWTVPFDGCLAQPFDGGGGAAPLTTPVGTDVADRSPSLFDAVTATRRVLSASTVLSVYVLVSAPLMLEQLPPSPSQRRHW